MTQSSTLDRITGLYKPFTLMGEKVLSRNFEYLES